MAGAVPRGAYPGDGDRDSLTDLLDDQHLVETGFWQERDTDAGRLRFPGIPTSFSETPGAIGDPGPALGGDSRAVLAEAGLTMPRSTR